MEGGRISCNWNLSTDQTTFKMDLRVPCEGEDRKKDEFTQ